MQEGPKIIWLIARAPANGTASKQTHIQPGCKQGTGGVPRQGCLACLCVRALDEAGQPGAGVWLLRWPEGELRTSTQVGQVYSELLGPKAP